MEHIRINDKLRLELVKGTMAPIIFETINRDREYLRKWLPFVDFTKQLGDTEAFVASLTSQANKKDKVYSIWYREEFAGLIGFKDTDWVNRKSEMGYWLAEKMQGKGIVSQSAE
jgi:ribosomal-protein-serine acetyltransferase